MQMLTISPTINPIEALVLLPSLCRGFVPISGTEGGPDGMTVYAAVGPPIVLVNRD